MSSFQTISATLREAKGFLLFGALSFVAGIVLGYSNPAPFAPLLSSVYSLADTLRAAAPWKVIGLIFLQNSTSALLAIWAGVLLGVVPLLGAVMNGVLIGSLAARIGGEWTMFLSLLPHGIFELPAIITAWGLGMWRGMWPLAKEKKKTYRHRARLAYRVYLMLILPLLAIAAVIEGTGIVLLR